jgi:hypothetical protein
MGDMLLYQKKLYFYIKSFFWQFIWQASLYNAFYKKTQRDKFIRKAGKAFSVKSARYAIDNTGGAYSPFKVRLISPYIVKVAIHIASVSDWIRSMLCFF